MNPQKIRWLKIKDALARWTITGGGLLIIVVVLGILVLITGVAAPLFFAPTVEKSDPRSLPASASAGTILAAGTDDHLETMFLVGTKGVFTFVDTHGSAPPAGIRLQPPGKGAPSVLWALGGKQLQYTLVWSNGWVSMEQVVFHPVYDRAGKRRFERKIERLGAFPPFPAGETPLQAIARKEEEGKVAMAALLPGNRLAVTQVSVRENLSGEKEQETHQTLVEDDLPGSISALAMNSKGSALYGGTENGYLLRWEMGEPGEVTLVEKSLAFPDNRAISALALLAGDTTLAVGDSQGGVTTWFPLAPEKGEGAKTLRKITTMAPHSTPVMGILPSERNRSLVSFAKGGSVHFDHATTGTRLLTLRTDPPLIAAGLSPRFNGLAGVDATGSLALWKTDIPHPEAGAATFIGKIWYEAYREPAYVWQSSSGEDDFEPKLSLVPLVFGTLKGTLYGMVFAVPLAILGALYTSHLMRRELRQVIKPTVEVMGSVPSVVIGFLAALWLAPIIKVSLLAMMLLIPTLPLVVVAAFFAWERLAPLLPNRSLERGREFLLLIPLVILAVWGCLVLGGLLEGAWFGGDLSQWLYTTFEFQMDQRNSIVIAFALGFAVVPIIFTIADDALVNVPRNLTAASLALGASRWQTVWNVVLPSASPGIFAAVMIGFGRAVGETMIVLMATGNTPIMDWSPLNGMRTLSANIAVEIPEAPVNSTLYRTLFLSAVVLFLVTFILNSLAEIIRQKLRRKYANY